MHYVHWDAMREDRKSFLKRKLSFEIKLLCIEKGTLKSDQGFQNSCHV